MQFFSETSAVGLWYATLYLILRPPAPTLHSREMGECVGVLDALTAVVRSSQTAGLRYILAIAEHADGFKS